MFTILGLLQSVKLRRYHDSSRSSSILHLRTQNWRSRPKYNEVQCASAPVTNNIGRKIPDSLRRTATKHRNSALKCQIRNEKGWLQKSSDVTASRGAGVASEWRNARGLTRSRSLDLDRSKPDSARGSIAIHSFSLQRVCHIARCRHLEMRRFLANSRLLSSSLDRGSSASLPETVVTQAISGCKSS